MIRELVGCIRDIYPDFAMPMVLVLLEVAQADGITVTQVVQRTGLTQASASRHCRGLTAQRTANVPGFDLCEWRPDPNDFRSKRLFLNSHGRRLIQQLEQITHPELTQQKAG